MGGNVPWRYWGRHGEGPYDGTPKVWAYLISASSRQRTRQVIRPRRNSISTGDHTQKASGLSYGGLCAKARSGMGGASSEEARDASSIGRLPLQRTPVVVEKPQPETSRIELSAGHLVALLPMLRTTQLGDHVAELEPPPSKPAARMKPTIERKKQSQPVLDEADKWEAKVPRGDKMSVEQLRKALLNSPAARIFPKARSNEHESGDPIRSNFRPDFGPNFI